MSNKSWPKNGKPTQFDKITDPCVEAMRIVLHMEDEIYKTGVQWNGLDVGKEERICCFSPDETLDAKNLTYSNEDQGRDAINEVIGIAVQLGIEQGRRMVGATAAEGIKKIHLKLLLDHIKENTDKIITSLELNRDAEVESVEEEDEG